MRISLIVAVAQNGVIGNDGDLAWRLPADLRFFKQKTTDHHVIMGRKTYESIGRPLPRRTFVVLSRRTDFVAEGCHVVADLESALRVAREAGEQEAFVIGGAEIYRLALPVVDRMYITRVHADVQGDTVLPEFAEAEWELIESEAHEADDRNPYPFTFTTLDRR